MSNEVIQKGPALARVVRGRGAVLLAAALAVAGTVGIASAASQRKEFTQQDVASIATVLGEADPATYRVRLPVLRDGHVVGSKVYGSLPLGEVAQRARSLGVTLERDANIQAVFASSGAGDDDRARDEGSGPGSHTQSSSGGTILADIETHLAEIDASRYQLLR